MAPKGQGRQLLKLSGKRTEQGKDRNGHSQASRVHVYTCTFLFLGVEKEQKTYVEIVESN